jgi:hypothetical protein
MLMSLLKKLQSWPDKMQEDVHPEEASLVAKLSTMTIQNCEAEKPSQIIGYSVQRCLPRWMRRRMHLRKHQVVVVLAGREVLLTDLCSTSQVHSVVQELDQFWVALQLRQLEESILTVATMKISAGEEYLAPVEYQ